MISGYVVNNSGKYMHIFKLGMFPGMTISLEDLYSTYSRFYSKPLDVAFAKWIDENKLPEGFDLVIEKYEELEEEKEQNIKTLSVSQAIVVDCITLPTKLTSKQIVCLKIKDDPQKVLSGVSSVHKLRRALSECKELKGKATLIKHIKERIAELT